MEQFTYEYTEELKRLPIELRRIIVEEALGDEPIKNEEAKMLLDNYSDITLFYCLGNECKTCTYMKRGNIWMYAGILIIYHNIDDISYYRPHSSILRSENPDKEEIQSNIIGRLGADIIKVSDEPINISNYITNESSNANIILIELLAIYRVLLERFKLIVIENKAKLLAKKYTLQILNNIVDEFGQLPNKGDILKDNKLPILILYLKYSGIGFEYGLDIPYN